MGAETAKLIASLTLKDEMSKGINSAVSSIGKLETRFGKVGQGINTVGRGIGTAIKNGALLAGVALGGLAALLVRSVKEGQDAAKVQTIYATAIANSGKVSAQYVAALNAQQTALMNLGGVDDELIKSEQTRLIQMGLTGAQVQKLTPLILDMSKATGKDLLTSTLAVGKATNGNVAGLQRYGIVIDKAKAKVDPFAAVVDALNQKFGGTTQALSGSLDARLGALRENMANIREEVGIKLLPALTRIVDVAGKDLVPAFGKFIDRILPSVISGVDKFASLLEGGGAERAITGITDALGPMVDMLKIAAEPVKAIVKAFLSLPSQVQGILIGGFAINKLSGGLIGQGVGQIAGGLLQRGGTPANPLFVADVTGGFGGLGAAGAAAGGIGAGTIAASAALLAVPIVLAAAATGAFDNAVTRAVDKQEAANRTFFGGKAGGMVVPGTQNLPLRQVGDFGAPHPGSTNAGSTTQLVNTLGKDQRKNLAEMAILQRAIAKGFHPSQAQVTKTYDKDVARAVAAQEVQAKRAADAARASVQAIKDGDASIVAAIRGIPASSISVSVTASDISKVVNVRRRAVTNRNPRTSLAGANEFG